MDRDRPIHGQTCPRCVEGADRASLQGYCATHHAVWQRDRWAAVAWARWVLRASNVVLLDTETTGLDHTAEVVEIALLTRRGEVLFDSLIRPVGPIPAAATAIHHLDDAAVAHAPMWAELYPRIAGLLHRRFVVVYNAAYDRRMLEQSCVRAAVPSLRPFKGRYVVGSHEPTLDGLAYGRQQLADHWTMAPAANDRMAVV
ncbi:MAG: 3'-5' exonuclease, partial [Chloroflexota bacterium]|nr:3'-5' exonuclease [Chloroflexota bacterium]